MIVKVILAHLEKHSFCTLMVRILFALGQFSNEKIYEKYENFAFSENWETGDEKTEKTKVFQNKRNKRNKRTREK